MLESLYPVKIYTNNQTLLSVLKEDDAKVCIIGWQMQLSEHDIEIHHMLVSPNMIADAMCRLSIW